MLTSGKFSCIHVTEVCALRTSRGCTAERAQARLPQEWGLCMGFCEPGMGDWLQGCSAVAVTLRINTTQCLGFENCTAWNSQLGVGLEKAKDKLKMWKREGVGRL